MRRSMLLVLFAGLVLAAYCPGTASAQLECTDPDLVAVVFDNGDINYNPPVGSPFNLQIILLNPTDMTGFNGFEFKFKVPANTFTLSTIFPPGSICLPPSS